LVTPTLFALSLTSPIFLPGILTAADRVSLILSGIVVGLIFGGLLEELGWTGFAVPGLRRRYSAFTTGLLVGLLWGVWHFLPTFWGSGDSSGVLSPSLLLPPCVFYVGVLPAYRVLMVWVYDRTGSLLVVMLMHASLTASTLFILAPQATGVALVTYYLVLAAVLWVVVAVAAVANRGQFSRQPLPRQEA
jgi:membrane protease YdiL (CAAX protease family)